MIAETGEHAFVLWSVKLCMPIMLKGGGHETNYHLNWLSCEQAVAAKLDVYWPLQCSHHLS